MGLLMTDSAADYRRRILLIMLFGVAMGYLEAAVVVYLRALFYPAGFAFPLHLIPQHLLVVELIREAAGDGNDSGISSSCSESGICSTTFG
jgi:hypothetical protein